MGRISPTRNYNLDFSAGDGDTNTVNLPLLVSVPHGGYAIPPHLRSHIALNIKDIFVDSDPCTREIYSFRKEVSYYHETDIARAVVDLNRSWDDLPPVNPDGVVKSHTVMGAEVYKKGRQPDRRLTSELLQRYYYPYHKNIVEDMADPLLICGLDCHSMLEFLPGDKPCEENARPFICLSNCGDENGLGREEDISCPPELINLLAECLRSEFPDEADSILLNQPFKGGHISQLHGRRIPWIQLEINRRAYLSEPWFDPDTLRVDRGRLLYLRDKLLQAIMSFCEEAGSMKCVQNFTDLQHQAGHLSPFFF